MKVIDSIKNMLRKIIRLFTNGLWKWMSYGGRRSTLMLERKQQLMLIIFLNGSKVMKNGQIFFRLWGESRRMG